MNFFLLYIVAGYCAGNRSYSYSFSSSIALDVGSCAQQNRTLIDGDKKKEKKETEKKKKRKKISHGVLYIPR